MSALQSSAVESGSAVRLERALIVFTLWAFAVAQPIYDLLRPSPEFLIVHDLAKADVFLLLAVVSLGFPSLLILLQELAAALSQRLGRAVHRLFAFALALLFFHLVGKRLFGAVHWVAPVSFGVLAAVGLVAVLQRPAARLLMRYASPAVLVFPVIFLLDSGIRGAVFPPRPELEGAARSASDTPIVLLVFDGLPLTSLLAEPGRIDAVRYPHFAELAASATWFVNAATVADTTLRGVPAIESGSFPRPGALPTRAYYPLNLFTLLGEDYRLVVQEPLTRLCPGELCPGRGLPFGERWAALFTDLWFVYLHVLATGDLRGALPPIDNSWRDFREESRDIRTERRREEGQWRPFEPLAIVEHLCERIDPERPRSAYFLHSLVPHPAHRYLPSGQVYTRELVDPSGEGRQFGAWSDDEWAVLHSYQRHLLQVGFTDRLLGEILERLRGTRLYDEALVVVTADHGASFRPGESHRRLTPGNAADVLSVPLLIKFPHQVDGVTDERPVQTVDILPTIAAVLGIDLGGRLDGHSLLDPVFSRPRFSFRGSWQTELAVGVLGGRVETLSRKKEIFGTGETRGEFVAPAYRSDLIGVRLDELHIEDASSYRGRLQSPGVFGAVRPWGHFVPAQIVGSVELDTYGERPACLAVAVNGTIRATTCTYGGDARGNREARFSALVPPESLVKGRNQIDLLIIEDDADGRSVLVRVDLG